MSEESENSLNLWQSGGGGPVLGELWQSSGAPAFQVKYAAQLPPSTPICTASNHISAIGTVYFCFMKKVFS